MCELLGMSANVPTDICFSFAGLINRGGKTGPHGDGWGIVLYDGKGCRGFHDPNPSAGSEIANFLRHYPIKSRVVISHIRRANRGRVALENTHPFTRELWGRPWTFAHNGQLRGIKHKPLSQFNPIGTTDSEHAFCWMMDELRRRWPKAPKPSVLDDAIREICDEIGRHGVFNLLLSDGKSLYCFCGTRLSMLTRRSPFGRATLIDEDLQVDFKQVTSDRDVVTIVATLPLTSDEVWTQLQKGTLTIVRDGEIR